MAAIVFSKHNANRMAQQAQRVPGLYCRTLRAAPYPG